MRTIVAILHTVHTWYWQHLRMPVWRIVMATYAKIGYCRSLRSLRHVYGMRKLRVAFIVSEVAKWKGQSVYDLMSRSDAFDPFIAVIPCAGELQRGRDFIGAKVADRIKYFKDKQMMVASAWDETRGRIVDSKTLDADLIFYQQPWDYFGRLSPQVVSSRALTFYFPYYMLNNADVTHEVGLEFHRMIFGHIVNSAETAKMFESDRKSFGFAHISRFLPLGHPMMDNFYLKKGMVARLGYVIYAPHWSITYGDFKTTVKYGTFPWNGREILAYAKRHPEIKWVFKPHPSLRNALRESGAMCEREIDSYYREWERIGTACYTADYVDLFLAAKAMITDCGSFLTEFAATGSPIIRLVSDLMTAKPQPSLKAVYSTYYEVRNLQELYQALDRVVVGEEDPNGEERRAAVRAAGLLGTYAAKNIVDYLDRLLSGDGAEIK